METDRHKRENEGRIALVLIALLTLILVPALANMVDGQTTKDFDTRVSSGSGKILVAVDCLKHRNIRGNKFDIALFSNTTKLDEITGRTYSPLSSPIILEADPRPEIHLCVKNSMSNSYYGKCETVWAGNVIEVKHPELFQNLTNSTSTFFDISIDPRGIFGLLSVAVPVAFFLLLAVLSVLVYRRVRHGKLRVAIMLGFVSFSVVFAVAWWWFT